MSARRLTLVRHGRSSYVHPGGLMSADDMHAWREGYDAAGIVDQDAPPAALKQLVATADLLIASDLTRAIQSAERFASGHVVMTSALLREAPTDIPTWIRTRLPRPVWEWTMLVRWGYRILRGTDAPAADLARATKAAQWLDALSTSHQHIVVVTHGVFRRLLARQLESMGWRPEPERRSYDHWSVWALGK